MPAGRLVEGQVRWVQAGPGTAAILKIPLSSDNIHYSDMPKTPCLSFFASLEFRFGFRGVHLEGRTHFRRKNF